MSARLHLGSPWVLFAVGFVGAIVVTRRLITLPVSQVFFDKFDQRDTDAIVDQEFGGESNAGGAFTFEEREL